MKYLRLPLLLALCSALQGCLVASAVDLAATTVFTAGKLVVKGTGAIIEAAIPDGKPDTPPAVPPKPTGNEANVEPPLPPDTERGL